MTAIKMLTSENNNSSEARISVSRTRARGVPFKKGNPGKPKGARNKVTVLAEKLVEGDVEDIVRSIIASAKSGNPAAIAAVARILLHERRGRSVTIDLGGELDHSAASLARATTAVLQAAIDGVVSAEEAQQFGIVIAAAARAYELESLEQRVLALESEKN